MQEGSIFLLPLLRVMPPYIKLNHWPTCLKMGPLKLIYHRQFQKLKLSQVGFSVQSNGNPDLMALPQRKQFTLTVKLRNIMPCSFVNSMSESSKLRKGLLIMQPLITLKTSSIRSYYIETCYCSCVMQIIKHS